MKKVKKSLDHWLSRILIIIMSLMVINVVWQVFSRFILKDPSSFTEELARYLLIWLGILGASYVLGQKQHLAIDIVLKNVTIRSRYKLAIVIEVLVLLFSSFVLVVGGLRLTYITFELQQISAALQVPLGYVYVVIPISGFIMMVYSIISIFEYYDLLKQERGEDARI